MFIQFTDLFFEIGQLRFGEFFHFIEFFQRLITFFPAHRQFFFSIIQGFPAAVVRTYESFRLGELGAFDLAALIFVVVGVTAAVGAMTMAARKIPVQIPRKVVGRGRIREGQKSFIPLRINSAGVMPIIFAQSFIVVPGTAAAFMDNEWLRTINEIFAPNGWPYYITYGLLIVFFTYFQ